MAEEKNCEEVRAIRDLVGIPERASDYYGKETLPQCAIHIETENFIIFLWKKGYYGSGGDCSYRWLYVVHKPTQKWCKLIKLDQTWGGTWWKIHEARDLGESLQIELSAHCKSTYETVTDYDRALFSASIIDSEDNLIVSRLENPVITEEDRLAAEEALFEKRRIAEDSVASVLHGTDISDEAREMLVDFVINFDAEVERVRKAIDEMWEKKHPMLTGGGYSRYRTPLVRQVELDIRLGIGAFVIEEQIDHRAGGDAQMRNELFVMKAGETEARSLYEDHAYESDRSCRIAIQSISADEVVVAAHDREVAVKAA